MQRTWSEDGGRIEPCKDGEDRWVKLTPTTVAALRAHFEGMELEGSLTWMLEEGADLRYVKDQMGHSSIDETEGTYGHLEVERHEQRVDLDRILAWPTAR